MPKSNSKPIRTLVKLALYKSEGAHYSYGAAKSLYLLGSAADKQGKPALATSHFLNALQIYETMNDSESWSFQANIYLTLGAIFRQHHKTQETIDMYEKGIDLALKANNNQVLVKLLHNAAFAYRTGSDFGSAANLLIKELDYIDSDNIKGKIRVYNELGVVYYSQKKYKKAKHWLNKILEIEVSASLSHFRGQALHNLANVFKAEGNYKEAWELFHLAASTFGPLGLPNDRFLTYKDMADLALIEGNQSLALSYAEKVMPLLNQVPNTPEYFYLYRLLSKCFEESNADKALVHSNTYGEKHEEFFQIQKDLIAQIEGFKLDLVLANHEKQLLLQAQQKKLIYTVLALLVLCLMTYMYMDYRKRKYRLHLIEQINFFVQDDKLVNKW